jgi:hypothetical protein
MIVVLIPYLGAHSDLRTKILPAQGTGSRIPRFRPGPIISNQYILLLCTSGPNWLTMVLSEGRKDHISCFPVCHLVIPVWMAKKSLESETSRVSYLKNSDGLLQGTKPRPRNQFQFTCFSLSLLYSYYGVLYFTLLTYTTRYYSYLALRPFLLALTTLHGPYSVVVTLPEARKDCALL